MNENEKNPEVNSLSDQELEGVSGGAHTLTEYATKGEVAYSVSSTSGKTAKTSLESASGLFAFLNPFQPRNLKNNRQRSSVNAKNQNRLDRNKKFGHWYDEVK